MAEYERRIAELEQLLGKKEMQIALLKKLARPEELSTEEKVSFVEPARDEYSLTAALSAAQLPKSTLRLRSVQALVLSLGG